MDTIALLGSVLGIGFLSGVRLYFTVLVIGLAVRLGWLDLHGELSSLAVLADTRVLVAAGVLVLIEFIADKIPWVDSLWDSIHTVIRPLGAAAIAAQALGTADPATRTVFMILSGTAALTGHSSKAAARLAVNHSPEPFSNLGLSLLEDLFVPVALWFALRHPVLTLSLLAVFLAIFLWLAPKIFRFLRLEFTALLYWIGRFRSPGGMRAAATRGIPGLRNSVGLLQGDAEGLVFSTRRWFRPRTYRIPWGEVSAMEWKAGLLLDRLILRVGPAERSFYVFKTADPRAAIPPPPGAALPRGAGSGW